MTFFNGQKRFSFKIDGRDAWELPYREKATQNGNTLTTVYSFDCGIRVTNVTKKYPEFDAYEWVNYIENTADKASEIISELYDCDCELPIEHEDPKQKSSYMPDIKKATKIYAPTGSTCEMYEFYSDPDHARNNKRINHLDPDKAITYKATGGRSSGGKNAPFFNVHKNGKGYVFAIGWTGQWLADIKRTEDTVILRSKIEDTHFRMLPDEKFRTSSVVIMPYEGDFVSSQNKWRRLVKTHFSLIGSKGRPSEGGLCTSVWGGMPSAATIERVKAIKELGLPLDYIWMDAGWCGGNTLPSANEFEGDWAEHTGDWRISHNIHPEGLCDVSEEIHKSGMKFILWFEPERVRYQTPIVSEHPEYFLKTEGSKNNLLLNLGNEKAWEYCVKTVGDIIAKLGIDLYRQDFNFEPLQYWRENDTEDRQGISEIKHINGMYRFWDALLERFPNLCIDNCASGGRRIDIETLRRSIPMWRSDYQCPANFDAEASQCHAIGFNTWMPYSGIGTGRLYDEYRVRSSYAASLTSGYFYTESEPYAETPEKVAFLRKYFSEYLRVRPYFSEDFYPLTEYSDKLDIWCAWQLDRPEQGDGIVQVFRRENSPYPTAIFPLCALDKDADYRFEDADGGEFTVSGRELTENGLCLTIDEKRKAKLYFYKKISN